MLPKRRKESWESHVTQITQNGWKIGLMLFDFGLMEASIYPTRVGIQVHTTQKNSDFLRNWLVGEWKLLCSHGSAQAVNSKNIKPRVAPMSYSPSFLQISKLINLAQSS